MSTRKIIHIDMDCFYAAVEEKYNPRLKGIPMAVGGPGNSRGVVCTANYEARKFGVKAAIPSARAVKLCPHLILVPPNFALYKKESAAVREIFSRFTDQIQPLSLDEAYLDVTECKMHQGSATLIAQEIRKQIFKETKLTASAGVAPNKFLAKIASDWNKPNGQFVIRPQDVESFMPALTIDKIWGVGKVTAEKMRQKGFFTCGDLQKTSLVDLKKHFGLTRANELYHLCRGEDDRPVRINLERKSLSVEETYPRDLENWNEVVGALPGLYKDWKERFERSKSSHVKSAVVKMRFQDFKRTTHEEAMSSIPLFSDFERLLESAWSKKPQPIRLLGIGVRLATGEELPDTAQLGFAI